jgi:hypothetical protein
MSIMSWSKCSIEIGETGASDAMATVLTSIGTIKDKSSSLDPTSGDSLTAKATGGELIAMEETEGTYVLKTRVIEPGDALYVSLGLGTVTTDELGVKTHVVEGDFSVKVTPKNIGAKGIKAAKSHVVFKPGWSEEEGQYADVEFTLLMPSTGVWYTRFTKTA